MQAVNRVAKNTVILYARMAVTVVISLYATRLILNALGIEDFGLFNVVGGVIAMLGFLNGSMAAATQRYMSFAQGAKDIEKINRIFNMSVVLHLLIAIIVLLLLEIVGFFFFNGILNIPISRISTAKIIYQFMVASTFFTIVSVPYEAVITSHENMLLYAIIGIIESLLKLGIALYITFSTYDHLIVYGLLTAVLSVLLLFVRQIYCVLKYEECKIKIRQNYDKNLLKEMTAFAGWSFLGTSSSMLANYGQGIVINIFFGTVVNAAQGIANQVSGQLGVFAVTLIKALNPMIDKSEGAGNRSLMLKASMIGCKVSFFLLVLMYIPFLIEMPYILGIWLKNVPEYAVIFCRLLLLRNLIDQIVIPLISSIVAVGNIKKFQLVISLFNFTPLIFSYFLFKINYPPYIIYIMFLLYSLFSAFVTVYFANRNCGLSIPMFLKNVIGRSLTVFILVLVVSCLTTYFTGNGMQQFISVLMVSTCSLFILIWLIGLNVEEKDKIRIMTGGIFKFLSK